LLCKSTKGVITKFKIVLTACLALSSVVSAHGVEIALPTDAKNAEVASVQISDFPVGERLVTTTGEGPVYENTYEKRLEVVVAYNSNEGANTYEGVSPRADQRPYTIFTFKVSKETLDAIKERRTNASSLVKISTNEKRVQVPSDAQYTCAYYGDEHRKIDEKCVEPEQPPKTITAPVLLVEVNETK
jgi:hypothetical protein